MNRLQLLDTAGREEGPGIPIRMKPASQFILYGIFRPSAFTVFSSSAALPSFFVTTPKLPE